LRFPGWGAGCEKLREHHPTFWHGPDGFFPRWGGALLDGGAFLLKDCEGGFLGSQKGFKAAGGGNVGSAGGGGPTLRGKPGGLRR